MASDNEASCENDPNFAVICAFLEKFGATCGLQTVDFLDLQEMLENTQEVRQELIDLHIKLLRKSRKTVSNERWEKAIIKFCHTFCIQDAWEIERFGYKKARLSSKLRVLKELLEMQFDFNMRFKAEINKMSAEELRSQPIGRDKQGHAYWFQNDNNCQIRVYKDDQDEETWTLVAKDRDGLASLISELSDGDSKFSSESAINEEDSNSLAEKPIIDTGQVDSSSDSAKKTSGDSENSNESSTKKEEDSNISAAGETDAPSDEEDAEEKKSTKRPRDEAEDARAAKKMRIEEEVGEAIEEPLMLVVGEGGGEQNRGVNPIVGEEIEEDLMFFCGSGNGEDCQTGNEDKPSDGSEKGERDTSDSGVVSISSKNCVIDEVPTPPAVVKSPYKLGTIIDTKTDNKLFSGSTKSSKKSRWDVEAIMAPPQEAGRVRDLVTRWEQQQQQQVEAKEEQPKKSLFFFGPGCLQFKPATVAFGQKVPPEAEDAPTDKQGDVGYRIDNKEATSGCVQSGSAGPIDRRNEHPTPLDRLSDNVSAADVETKVEEQVRGEESEISEREERIQKVEPMPVIEEICVKKHAYVLGDEASTQNHHTKESAQESETVIPDEDVNVEGALDLRSETVSRIDENENKHVVVEQATKGSDEQMSKVDGKSDDDIDVAERDADPDIELSTSDEATVALSNCDAGVEKKHNWSVPEGVEEKKSDEDIRTKLPKFDERAGAESPKCDDREEKAEPKLHFGAEVSQPEDERSVGSKISRDDAETVPLGLRNAETLKCDENPKSEIRVSACADREDIAIELSGFDRAGRESKSGTTGPIPSDVAIPKPDDRIGVALPTGLDNPVEDSTPKTDDQDRGEIAISSRRDVTTGADPSKLDNVEVVKCDDVSNPDDKKDAAENVDQPEDSSEEPVLESRKAEEADGLESRNVEDADVSRSRAAEGVDVSQSDGPVGLDLSKCDDTVDASNANDGTNIDGAKSVDKVERESVVAYEGEDQPDLEVSKSDDRQLSKTSDAATSIDGVAEQESIVVSEREERPVEIVKASKSDDSQLSKGSGDVKIDRAKSVDKVEQGSVVVSRRGDQQVGIPEVSKSDHPLPKVSRSDDRQSSKGSDDVDRAKSVDKVEQESVVVSKRADQQVEIPMASRSDDPLPKVSRSDDRQSSRGSDDIKCDRARSVDKVEQESIVVSKREDQQVEIPKVLSGPDDPLPKVSRSDDRPLSKGSDDVKCDRAKSVYKVERESIVVSKRADQQVDIPEVSKSDHPLPKVSVDKLEQESIVVSKRADQQVEILEVSKSDDPQLSKSDHRVNLTVSRSCEAEPRETANEPDSVSDEKIKAEKNLTDSEERSSESNKEVVDEKETNEGVSKESVETAEETTDKVKESPKVGVGEPEKEKPEAVPKPVERSTPKVPLREVRRHTRRSAQMAKTESVDKEENPDATKETKKTSDKPGAVTKKAIVYLKTEDKMKVDERASQKVPAKRGRKNNSSESNQEEEKKARVAVTRRSTRSSKTAEKDEETVVEEKPAEPAPAKPRRGRPKKAAKEAASTDDPSKKIRLSTEEAPEVKRSLRSSQKAEDKEEGQGKPKEEKENMLEQTQARGKENDDDKVKDEEKDTERKNTKVEEVKEIEVEVKEIEKEVQVKEVEVKEDETKVEVTDATKVDDGEKLGVKEDAEKMEEVREEAPSPMSDGSFHDAEPFDAESDGGGSDIVEVAVIDPLGVEGEADGEETERKSPNNKPLSLSTFSLDFTESPAPTPPLTRRGLRKRGRDSPHEEIEETAGKRPKMKAKRSVDVKLRKSVEEQKKRDLSSSDDDGKSEASKKKKRHAKRVEDSVAVSSDAEKDADAEPTKKKGRKNKNQRLLMNLGIDLDKGIDPELDQGIGVRQSRRIAQLKIREEAERRKYEEEFTYEKHKKKKSKKSEDKDYKVEKKKSKPDAEEEDVAEDSNDSKKKHKKKKKRHRRLFDEANPWRSSSDSSTDEEEENVEEEEEEDEDVLQYVSDHEFSPESDMEGDSEAQPPKRARTAKKETDVTEVDDCPCQRCGKSDHPEWILLCDSCDNGWHCSCLRPALLVIPEGDWFCPPCQHASLLTKLQAKLIEYDKKLNKKEIEDRRKQRLAYVGISLNSVLPAKDTENVKKRRRSARDPDDDGDDASSEESDSGSGSGSESGSDSDEPIYQLRQRRQAHSYRFNDFDELINSAIQDEMDAVKGAGNQGRGKDIATIVNAEKEEERKKEEREKEAQGDEVPAAYDEDETLPPVVPVNDKDKEAKPIFDDDEDIQVRKKIVGRKKHRKLNALDISSADDDADSDEDFKGTSSESDDDFDEDLGSDDSDLDNGRGRRKGMDPVRRSTRARTSRFDADFIDDGESDSEDAPRRKKKRSIWDDSESEESDRSWGRRRRKPASRPRKSTNTPKKKSSKKKKKKRQDSDEEVYKKKKPKIKFGLDEEDDGPVRRTRGKKITYVDALGSDTDEDRVKRPPPRIDSDEEYVANEDEKLSEDAESGDENSASKASNVQIQSYTDARFTQLLPEPKNLLPEDLEGELNPIDQINRNVEMMDENEMEKMMEEEEYANKQLQMVALQLEKEKRRKEREARKLEGAMQEIPMQELQHEQKKRARKTPKDQFQFSGPIQEPLLGDVDNLLLNSENNDELSEPPGVSLPLFAELGGPGESLEDPSKKRRGKTKKSLEEAVANLGSARQHDAIPPFMSLGNKNHPTDLSMPPVSNIEIAAPPQPFSQSQPTPSVITRMLQSKPGQGGGYPVGTIRPKQFATMPADDDHAMTSSPGAASHPGQYAQGAGGMRAQLASPYRQMAPSLNHFSRTAPPPQMRTPVPHMYHSHRSLDPSPSGGGAINMSDHNSPGRVVSPAASSPGSNKNETPPPPYARPPPGAAPPSRFPMGSPAPRHMQQMVHLQPNRPNLSPYHPGGMPPQYHYGAQFGQEDALPPAMYQGSPYSEAAFEGQLNPSESSNSKGFEDESGGEFGGLVSYFSSQREDDLES